MGKGGKRFNAGRKRDDVLGEKRTPRTFYVTDLEYTRLKATLTYWREVAKESGLDENNTHER